MNPVIKVSKSGKDVNSTSPKDYIIHTKYNAFQIVAKGKLTSQSINADPKTITIAHNLGYVPAALAFAKFPDGYVAMPQTGQRTGGYEYQRRFYLQMDSTNLYLKFYQGTGGTYSVDIAYYIFNSDLS